MNYTRVLTRKFGYRHSSAGLLLTLVGGRRSLDPRTVYPSCFKSHVFLYRRKRSLCLSRRVKLWFPTLLKSDCPAPKWA